MNRSAVMLGLLLVSLLVPPAFSSSGFSASDPEADESLFPDRLGLTKSVCSSGKADILHAGISLEAGELVAEVTMRDLGDPVIACWNALYLAAERALLRWELRGEETPDQKAPGIEFVYWDPSKPLSREPLEYRVPEAPRICVAISDGAKGLGDRCDGTVEGDTILWRLPLEGSVTNREGEVRNYDLRDQTFDLGGIRSEASPNDVPLVEDRLELEGAIRT